MFKGWSMLHLGATTEDNKHNSPFALLYGY